MSNQSSAGAKSYGGKRKHGLGWVPWLALLLLALTAAIGYLIVTNVSDKNDAAGLDLSNNEISKSAPNADDRKAPVPTVGNVPSASSTATAVGVSAGGLVGGGGAPAVAAQATPGAVADASSAGTVLFSESSAVLDDSAHKVIANAAALVQQRNLTRVSVTGYTDVVGNESSNGTLSQERARAVATALDALLPSSVTVGVGARGEQNPVANNTNADGSDNPQGRQLNRRAFIAVS